MNNKQSKTPQQAAAWLIACGNKKEMGEGYAGNYDDGGIAL